MRVVLSILRNQNKAKMTSLKEYIDKKHHGQTGKAAYYMGCPLSSVYRWLKNGDCIVIKDVVYCRISNRKMGVLKRES